jgi:ribosome-binding protein aMBF1 (putative translation factor)
MATQMPSKTERTAMMAAIMERHAEEARAAKTLRRRRSSISRKSRERMRRAQTLRYARVALADDNTSPLRLARIEAGWSRPELARAARVSVSTVKRAERGERNVRGYSYTRLADALGVDRASIAP